MTVPGTLCRSIAALAAFGLPPAAPAGEGSTEDACWIRFADRLEELCLRQREAAEVREVTRLGGYHRWPEFYREVSYYERATGRLLCLIQREREHPERLHAVKVYLYDREGRVVRDYSATYLPWTRTRPALTLISLHRHAPALHAWRTFDASGNRVFEACEGSLGDGPVAIRVDYADPAGMSATAKLSESRAPGMFRRAAGKPGSTSRPEVSRLPTSGQTSQASPRFPAHAVQRPA
jgi:hypothetical protein